MPRRLRRPILDASSSPDSIAAWMQRYLEQQRVLGITEHYWTRMRDDLVQFQSWCQERHLTQPHELTLPILERYQRQLFYRRKANGEPLSASTQVRHLARLKHWCRWLVRLHMLPSNPASELTLPRAPRRILPHVLTREEVETLLSQPDVDTLYGSRDRTMLEVLYSTGMRRMELVGLDVFDVAFGRGTVLIRQGKGQKDRLVPIGERALAWLHIYLNDTRPLLLADPTDAALFIGRDGGRIGLQALGDLVRRYLDRAGIKKPGACHLLRHAAATLMLEGGADIRFIQVMLGHAKLGTTELYTHVSIDKLKDIHNATHPGARLVRRSKTSTSDPTDSAILEPEPDS